MQGGYLDCCGNEKRMPGRKRHPPSSPSPFAKVLRHSWPSTCRRYPAAGCKITECDHARPAGRPAATLSAHPEAVRFLGLIGPAPARAMEAAWLCYLLMRRRHDQHDYGAAIRYADTLLS